MLRSALAAPVFDAAQSGFVHKCWRLIAVTGDGATGEVERSRSGSTPVIVSAAVAIRVMACRARKSILVL